MAIVATACFVATPLAGAAELIDSSTINSIGSHNWGTRDAWRTLNGSVASNTATGGTLATDNSLFLDPGGSMDPDDATAWLLDGTAGNTGTVGQNSCWSGWNHSNDPSTLYIIYDLGADTKLDSINVWNIQVTDASRTNRSVNQADIFFRPASAGTPPTYVNHPEGSGGTRIPWSDSGWTILGTQGTQTFPISTVSDTMAAPTNVPFGSVSARWVAIVVETAHGDGSTAGLGEVQFFLDDTAAVDDPVLGIDPSNSSDFAVGNVFGDTSHTVTFINNSDGGSGTINIDSVTITDDGGGGGAAVFGTPILTYSNPGTAPLLANGETVTIEVPVLGSTATPGAVNGEISIDTTSAGGNVGADHNDLTLAISATVYGDEEKLNPNPFMETGLTDWDVVGGGATNAVPVSPGLSGGSIGMARVPGQGDPINTGVGGTHPNAFMQSTGVPNGASDWQLSAFFTPVDGSDANYDKYVDPNDDPGIDGADGSFTDRSFQWVLLSADTGRPFPTFGNGQAAGTIINIAYMPDGITTGGTPDFYVFDSATSTWQATGIGAIEGSIDNDTDGDKTNGVGDGLLDTSVDALDVINSYRLLVTGTGFGTPGASYTIHVSKFSGPDSFPTAGVSSGPLSFFQGASGMTNTPAGYAFITSDESDDPVNGSNPGDGSFPGFTTPFWVDDVCFFNGTGPDPALAVLSTPGVISLDGATSGTTTMSIRNDGTTTNLEIDPIALVGGTGFSVTDPVGAFTVIPGAVQEIEITWDSTAASGDYESTVMTVADSTNGFSEDFTVNAGVATPFSDVLANGSFEIAGTDTIGNTDNFADWDEQTGEFGATPEGVFGVPGLITGVGTTAAYMGPSAGAQMVGTLDTPLNNFDVEMDFAVKGSGRAFNVFFKSTLPTNTDINLRYVGGIWYVFENVESSGGWVQVLNYALTPSVDDNGDNDLEDPGDTKVTYKLKFTGSGWGTSTPSYTIEIQDSTGTPLATTPKLEVWRNSAPTAGDARLETLTFSSEFESNPGFWADNVVVSGQTLNTDPAAPESFRITAFSIDRSTGMGSVTFSPTTAGVTYELRASNDANISDLFSANLIMSDLGVDGETTFNFTDAAATTTPTRTYRVEDTSP
ncbi:MAG: hypothetical protein AAGB14_03400 [Verrucomicrobiota bacterium]